MTKYIVLAALNGEFLASSGNVYENFQMFGYVEANDSFEAVKNFFEEPQFPIDWGDVMYMWAESLGGDAPNGHYGDYRRVFIDSLMNPPVNQVVRKYPQTSWETLQFELAPIRFDRTLLIDPALRSTVDYLVAEVGGTVISGAIIGLRIGMSSAMDTIFNTVIRLPSWLSLW